MNAYELADELQELDAKLHLIDLFKSAVMLRQQADRIAELENPIMQAIGMAFEKPLSDEEIKELIVNKTTDYELCRAIEERHGIK